MYSGIRHRHASSVTLSIISPCPSDTSMEVGFKYVVKHAIGCHRSSIDNSDVIVDYIKQQLLPGWLPRMLPWRQKKYGRLRFCGPEIPFSRMSKLLALTDEVHESCLNKDVYHQPYDYIPMDV